MSKSKNQPPTQKNTKTGSIYIPGLEEWMLKNAIRRPHPIFLEVEAYAKEHQIPILSPLAGANLAGWVRAYQPKKILELGTGAGYSLLWILQFVEGAKIVTIDRNLELLQIAEDFYRKSPYQHLANVKWIGTDIGDFLQERSFSWENYDFVFVDSDKILYPQILKSWLASLEKRNLPILCFDNVLWHGRVLNPNPEKPSDQAILEFWNQVACSRLYYELIPSGDGLLFLYPFFS